MHSWQNWLNKKTNSFKVVRNRIAKSGGGTRFISTTSQKLLNFVSNDYLGLSHHNKLIKSLYQASKKYGLGSTGAPSLGGYSEEHQLLTEDIAQWLGFERCLLFSSGYQLNISLFSQLVSQDTHIWLDKNCHASHIDGVLLSRAKFSRFSSDALANLEAKIKNQSNKLHIIITEGCFSMDGINLNIDKLIKIKESSKEKILLVVDDAHGIGCLGYHGKGSLENYRINLDQVDLLIGTFGKSFASHGGFVCGNKLIIDYLQQTVRGQIYSTNLPPAIVAASRTALNIINSDEGIKLRQTLLSNIKHFNQFAINVGLDIFHCNSNLSPIQLVMFDSLDKLEYVYQTLLKKQILVGKILYPTVPKHSPRIRISLSAAHKIIDLKSLTNSLTEAYYE